MAEIFGVIAGTVGVLDVSKRGIDRLDHVCSRWRNAPQELLELRNEVEDLRVVLDQVMEAKTTIETTSQHDAPLAASLNEQYRKANDQLAALEDIVNALSSIKNYKKKYKWVRKEGKIETIKMRIRGVRESISSLLLAHGVIKSSRVELDILSVISVGNQQNQHVNSRLDTLSTGISETRNEVAAAHSDITASAATNSQQVVASLADTRLEVANMFQNFASHFDTRFDHLGTMNSGAGLVTRPPRQGSRPGITQSQSIQFTTARRGACSVACDCRCHSSSISSSTWQLPQILSFILGSLFLRYTGLPASIRFTYVFPVWLIQYSILFYLEKIAGRKPEMVLAMKNRVRWQDNPMFNACFAGDLKEVETLYRTSPWYARDIRDVDGTNPIFWALRQQNVEVAKFLNSVDGGTDNENDNGDCAQSYFAVRTITKYSEPGAFDSDIYQLLRLREHIDELGLPEITRSILGLPGSRPLRYLVENFPSRSASEAKMEDEFGKTALHWACRQGDAEAVAALVKLGANVNASRPNGYSPLHEAGLSKKASDCVNILFKAGVTLGRDTYGNTPLHVACAEGIVETVESLLDNGVSMEDLNKTGQSPLMLTTERDRFPILKLLLDRGADIGVADEYGGTALHLSVWANAHECAKELLSRGADRNCANIFGTNILHAATEDADERMLEILTKDGLRGLDVNVEDNNGQTAQKIFGSRPGVTDELKSAFERLIKVIPAVSTL
ncbi:Ankyrin repeat-containing protein [Fusarium austroafricanum]|uniref:Ankyrin repeat-containing protein n=1 Tax=Fusarium austroafricanum TaxID=2364996 RepID=A0A8H4KEU2_9HYPO|nr:Ankyrin repeat-containing protein [Fusarium austroafricanum]